MYSTVKSCVRVNGTLSEFLDSYMGVKQGEPFISITFDFLCGRYVFIPSN